MVRPLPKNVVLYTRAGGQDWGFSHPGAAIVGGASATDLPLTAALIIDVDAWLIEQPWPPVLTSVTTPSSTSR